MSPLPNNSPTKPLIAFHKRSEQMRRIHKRKENLMLTRLRPRLHLSLGNSVDFAPHVRQHEVMNAYIAYSAIIIVISFSVAGLRGGGLSARAFPGRAAKDRAVDDTV